MPLSEIPLGDRRNFYKQLTLAAVSGILAVSSETDNEVEAAPQAPRVKPKDVSNPLLCEPHVCRGLNTCKGKGRDGRNQCAGMGVCHTAPANQCGGQNSCRGLGACDNPPQPNYPGENTCKGKGGCEVPMLPNKVAMWKQARARFEALMADMGKKFGPAPQ